MANDSELVRDIVFEIQRVSTKLKVHPSLLRKSQFLKEAKQFSEWSLRKVGGLNNIIKAYFPQGDKDLKSIQEQKQQISYVNKLEKIVGESDLFVEKLKQAMSDEMSKMKVEINQLDEKATKDYLASLKKMGKGPDSKEKRSVVTLWSDHHFGTNVRKTDVGGKNEFTWEIGARRLGMLCEQIATYKIEKRDAHEELVILLDGDNIGGVIHNQEGNGYDLITHQVCGTTNYYIQSIAYLRNFFSKIRVICQPGNHSRMMHKSSKDRALQDKFDSFETIIHYHLSAFFSSDPKVSFEITEAPFSDVSIQGHRVFMTHGDTVFDVGDVGKTISFTKLKNQIDDLNMSETNKGNPPYEMVCTGHVHHPVVTQTVSGIKVMINGCLVGLDQFALGIGIHSSYPTQLLWETTKKKVKGDIRFIDVGDADADPRYEKIIKPYKRDLVFPKSI